MSKCKLYLHYPDRVDRIGEFKDKAAAEQYYNRYKVTLEFTHGPAGKPVYVESGKGRGNK